MQISKHLVFKPYFSLQVTFPIFYEPEMAQQFPKEPQDLNNANFADEWQVDHSSYSLMQYLVTTGTNELNINGCWYEGITIETETNQIFVIEYSFGSPYVSIFSETGNFINRFSHERMGAPYGIATYRGNVYTTDTIGHNVLQFKLSADPYLVGKLGEKGSEIAQFNDPKQLTVSTDGEVYVTDSYNHRIQILDCNLKYQRQISHDQMIYPIDVKLTQKSMYVLNACLKRFSDRSNTPCVHVFTLAGEILQSLITSGRAFSQVRESQFFCLDENKNIIFSGGRHYYPIKIFSKEGEPLEVLDVPDYGTTRFCRASGIALANNGKLVLAVSNVKNGIKIFSCW